MPQAFRNKPNFFVIGAEKAGTTRLCHLLEQHTDVFIAANKEPEYFSHVALMEQRAAEYEALFDAADATAIGEGSTFYSMAQRFPGTAERVHRFNSDARIVYILRHPLHRMESAYIEWLNCGFPPGISFRETVREHPALLEPSLYWLQLSQYRNFFPDDRILVLFFEDFIADETATLRACLAFLNVDPDSGGGIDGAYGKNAWQDHRQDRTLLRFRARDLPGFDTAVRLAPRSARRHLRNVLTAPVARRPEWDGPTKAWAVDRLRNDSRAVLAHAGKPDNFWDL